MTVGTGKLPIEYVRGNLICIFGDPQKYRLFQRRLYARLELEVDPKTQARIPINCLIDTGAPLCVIPHEIWGVRGLQFTDLGPLPPSVPGKLAWRGVDCKLGRIRVWYKPSSTAGARGPLDLVAKFPDSDLPKIGNKRQRAEVLIGLNFLSEHSSISGFQCHTEGNAGAIEFP